MKALVTGGGGFLGGAIVRLLIGRGDEVRSFSRDRYPQLESLGARCFRGDLSDAEAVAAAVEGVDVVFHVAAKAGVWGRYESYYQANVRGTEHVIAACRRHDVGRLVYTSTPSVVFHHEGMEGANESVPYAKRHLNSYSATKALAEKKVLEADDDGLSTVALRPHLIWGPGDNHLIPRLVARAKAGKLALVGTGMGKVDSVYVENAARAHLLAADRLAPRTSVAGKVYFISNDEPIPIAQLINRILEAAGLPPVTRRVPPSIAYAAGWILEVVYRVFGLSGEPPMTRFVARQLATPHWFDLSAAKRDLGYQPSISIDEGMRRLAESFTEPAAEGTVHAAER